MSIKIDKERCLGCRQCLSVCPGSLIQPDENNKALIRYPECCWGCASCVKECAVGAISFYLGADIGGRGSRLTVQSAGPLIHWHIEKADGSRQTITVNRQDANQY
ncbi:MAG: ferredoxin family protein [Peptococcaceae bacterium]|jgi:adenylylsulfate reductase subunit B|nr:ferredoxin family protein [Peptococcaceae bacterium]